MLNGSVYRNININITLTIFWTEKANYTEEKIFEGHLIIFEIIFLYISMNNENKNDNIIAQEGTFFKKCMACCRL